MEDDPTQAGHPKCSMCPEMYLDGYGQDIDRWLGMQEDEVKVVNGVLRPERTEVGDKTVRNRLRKEHTRARSHR